jgi:ATP-binding cassette subfamily C protein
LPAVVRTRAVRDLDTVRQGLGGPALLALMDAPWAPVFLLAAFLLHPLLGLATLLGALAMLVLAWLNERATLTALKAASDAAAVGYAAQDYASASAETVRALGMAPALVARHQRMRYSATDLQSRASFAAGHYLSAIKFVRLGLQSGALGLGAYLASHNQISAGAVIAASLLMPRTLAPVEQVVGGWRGLVQTYEAYRRLDDLLLRQDAARPYTALPPPRGDLRFERVSVVSPDGQRVLLRDISLQIAPGEIVAVVGPSGAGKSTLARTAVGAAAARGGVVRIDGAALGDWPAERLADHIGYLPQDFVLFAGTVKENISRFRGELAQSAQTIDAMAVAAAKAVGAHEMILGLPLGYDTPLGANGAGLSAGQRQKVALARALFGEPSVLVLDEPNAHMDTEGELALAALADRARDNGVSMLMVVHHGPLLGRADRVVVLADGRVQASGPLESVVTVGAPRTPPLAPPDGAPGVAGAP